MPEIKHSAKCSLSVSPWNFISYSRTVLDLNDTIVWPDKLMARPQSNDSDASIMMLLAYPSSLW